MLIHHEGITIIYSHNNRVSRYMKQKLTESKAERDDPKL